MRIEDAFRSSMGIETSDAAFQAVCGTCSTLQRLDECEVREEGGRSEYLCVRRSCDAVLLMLGPPDEMPGGIGIGADYLMLPMGAMWMGGEDAAR